MAASATSNRDATLDDAATCAAIYAAYVEHSAITLETEPPSPQDMADRIASALATHAWLVATDHGRVVGYAYAHAFNVRQAYDWSCEVSIYLEMGRRRTGTGRALYDALLGRLDARGYRMAVALITLPNEASVGLHRAFGFEDVGTWRNIGWKHGSWHDVALAQLAITDNAGAPPVVDR
jgi:L-amino acid N-acyltransferase YncA